MKRGYYDLPSLTALAAFEATARHGGMKKAAAELNVTVGAVSRQIKAIERELGTPLLRRGGAAVAMTPAGRDLFAALSQSFARVSDLVQDIRRGDRSRNVTLACTDAFATMWLMPRMPEFWRLHPGVSVDHVIATRAQDYERPEIELRIRYGHGVWPGETAVGLFGDVIYPVCGRGYARAHDGLPAAGLPDLALLHVDWAEGDWAGWREFFDLAGLPYAPSHGRRFGRYDVALLAAEADQGVAIGWDRLVGPLVRSGRLVSLTDVRLRAPGGYFMTWSSAKPLPPAADVLRRWLLEAARLPAGE